MSQEAKRFYFQPENPKNPELELPLKTAIIYLGQGQDIKKLHAETIELRQHPIASKVFDEGDKILHDEFPDRFTEGFSPIILSGSEDSLRQNQQLLVLLYNFACTRVLEQQREENGFKFPPKSDLVAVSGQSLGLISAIAESGAIDFANMLILGVKRQGAMLEANRQNPGTLVALTANASDKRVEKIMRDYELQTSIITASSLTVVGGNIEAVKQAVDEIRKMPKSERIRAIPLETDGAFHTSLMKPAAERLKQDLQSITITNAQIPVIANTTGNEIRTGRRIKKEIIDQLTTPVLWLKSTREMINKQVDQFVEIGNDGLLTGHIKRELEISIEDKNSLVKRLLQASGVAINAIGSSLTIRQPLRANPY